MHPDRDFDVHTPLPASAALVQQDLAVEPLVGAMADGDTLIATVASTALLSATRNNVATLRYRQAIVIDALAHPQTIRELYAITADALETQRKNYWGLLSHYPSAILFGSIRVLEIFMEKLRALRRIAEAQSAHFQSAGVLQLFEMLEREFDDAYLNQVATQLDALKFKDGTLVSARIGPACEGDAYLLHWPHQHSWVQRLLAHAPSAYTVRVAPRDISGAKTLSAMRDHGIAEVAHTLAQSVAHIQGFFELLRAELAFHVGCINLKERLDATHVSTCFPDPQPATGAPGFRARALCDVALALTLGHAVVTNTIDASGKRLVIVTGANQGGKSTFLRSLGLAQLMLQAGMFVAAEGYAAPLCSGLFTHCKREEDTTMRQGKLDEELARVSDIADTIRPGALLMCNESFASTNEREGSELARQMVDAMLERRIHVVFVTHLYPFARKLHEQPHGNALFLRAERLADGTRSFRLVEGAPQESSHGEDLYKEIFGADAAALPAGAAATLDEGPHFEPDTVSTLGKRERG